LIKARAGWSAVLAARHHGSFMRFARTSAALDPHLAGYTHAAAQR
jgi:hypothetical protein